MYAQMKEARLDLSHIHPNMRAYCEKQLEGQTQESRAEKMRLQWDILVRHGTASQVKSQGWNLETMPMYIWDKLGGEPARQKAIAVGRGRRRERSA